MSLEQLVVSFGPVGAILIVGIVFLWRAYQKEVSRGHELTKQTTDAVTKSATAMTMLAERIGSGGQPR